MANIRTANGGRAAVATEFDIKSTTREQRASILLREKAAREYTKSLPKRRKPEHERPGPILWIQF